MAHWRVLAGSSGTGPATHATIRPGRQPNMSDQEVEALQSILKKPTDRPESVGEARSLTSEALRRHAILMILMNEVRADKTAAPELISERAQAMRNSEKLVETL